MCAKKKNMENAIYAYLMVNETVNPEILSSFTRISKKEADELLKIMEKSGKLEKISSKSQEYILKKGNFSLSGTRKLSKELEQLLSKKLSEIKPFVKEEGITTKNIFQSEIEETARRAGILLRFHIITGDPSFLSCAETSIETFILPKIAEKLPEYSTMTTIFETLMLYETITNKRLEETMKIFAEITSITENMPDSPVEVILYSIPFWRSSRLMKSISMREKTEEHADFVLAFIDYLSKEYFDNISSLSAIAYIQILRHIQGLAHEHRVVESIIESLYDKITESDKKNIIESYPSLLIKVYYPYKNQNKESVTRELNKIILKFKEKRMLESEEDFLLFLDLLISPYLASKSGIDNIYLDPSKMINSDIIETLHLYGRNLCEAMNGDGGWGSADAPFGPDSGKILSFISAGINFLTPLSFAKMEDAKTTILNLKDAWKRAAIAVEDIDIEEIISIFKAGRYLYEHTGDSEIVVCMEILMDKLKLMLPNINSNSVLDEDEMEIFGIAYTCFSYLSLISENEKTPIDIMDFIELIEKDDEKWAYGLLISSLKKNDKNIEHAIYKVFFNQTYGMPFTTVSEYVEYMKCIIKCKKKNLNIKIYRVAYEMAKNILMKTPQTPEDFEKLAWSYYILKEV